MKRLTRSIFVAALVFASTALAGSGVIREKASACDTCFHESATAYSYCQANPGGTYVGCNFTHECSSTDTANSIYRQECQLKNAARR
jgi:hypothetical protein